MTATVAHELRNPLGAIGNSLYVIRQAVAENGNLGRAVERAERSIVRCNKIINNLLDYTVSRPYRLYRINVDQWLEAVLAEQSIPEWVEVERRFGAPGGAISADGDRLGRAITNLIENAVQAVEGVAEGASRRITIATTLGDDVEIAITDTGPGIPPDVLPQIFEPLFSTRSFGAGLGLAIVSQIIAQHGGKVGAESAWAKARRSVALPARHNEDDRRLDAVALVTRDSRDKNIKRGRALLSTPERSNDTNRSMTLEEFSLLADLPGGATYLADGSAP